MYDEPEIEEVDLDELPDDKQLTHDIDEALAKARPERYDSRDKDWMDPVIAKVEEELEKRDQAEIIADVAKRKVYRRESEATKRTNRILHDIADTGQVPLGWGVDEEELKWVELFFDVLHLPLSIAKERVRLGVAGANDLDQWVAERKREKEKRDKAETAAWDGALLLAKWVRDQGVKRVEDMKPPKAPESAKEPAKVIFLSEAA